MRAGDENLQAVAEGSLSLLRELILRSTPGSGNRVNAGLSETAGVAAAAGDANMEAAARRSLLAGLRGALPLLLETDSHTLVQVRPGRVWNGLAWRAWSIVFRGQCSRW